jgi:cell division septum initiation protein DivIVA
MDVLVLIDKLDDLVHNAKPVPLTDQVRVDKEEIYDILDQMRATIPEEEVTNEAKRAAEDIIEDARAREREIRLGAEDYADEILNTLEVNLSKFIAAVQRGRERLQGREEPSEVA